MASSSIAETVMPTCRMTNPGRGDEVAVYVIRGVATMAGVVGLRWEIAMENWKGNV
jgi:hypothetical protein